MEKLEREPTAQQLDMGIVWGYSLTVQVVLLVMLLSPGLWAGAFNTYYLVLPIPVSRNVDRPLVIVIMPANLNHLQVIKYPTKKQTI